MSDSAALVDRLDAVLPQTQCRQCGFDGCRPYARAMARGEAGPDRCPPGGDDGAARIAAVLGRDARPFDRAYGMSRPLALAVVDEAACIGCTLCIQACPVDAIVGAPKRLHAVIAERCTGCELCIAPCPVDCIALVPAPFAWDDAHAHAARDHHRTRLARLARDGVASSGEDMESAARERCGADTLASAPVPDRKAAILAGVLARSREREAARRGVGDAMDGGAVDGGAR